MAFSFPTAKALNHLLTQNSWALPRLKKFAGKTARFNVAPFSFAYTIHDDGSLSNADAACSADATCTFSPSLLPLFALRDETARSEIHSEGDAALLTEIFFLSQNLRWSLADNLSPFTGDIAAERIEQAALSAHTNLRDAATNLTQATTEYWTEERPLIAKPTFVSGFVQQVDALRDDIARLEQRIKHLAR